LLRWWSNKAPFAKASGARTPPAARGRPCSINEEECRMHRATRIGSSLLFTAAVALGFAPPAAHAQQGASMTPPSSTAEAQSAPASGQGAAGDSTSAFKAADERMMNSMQGAPYTGNADDDFVAHMIPHHQGAVDMAEVEAKYGKDPQLKRLAQQIIKSQRHEIEFMKRWQAKHGGKR
jgi:uncharacterized protein (DUF305 family)